MRMQRQSDDQTSDNQTSDRKRRFEERGLRFEGYGDNPERNFSTSDVRQLTVSDGLKCFFTHC